ncbi:MAG: hypothetical protein HQM06_16715 [Magnetococcales bacterium]|nr:hypothetical protein [Magnetococcales bacterium]
MNDFLQLEAKIVARLNEQLPDLQVYNTAGAMAAEESSMPYTALYVWFVDAVPGEAMPQHQQQKVKQNWTVELAVKNLFQVQSGEGARQEAGPLISKVLQAMIGWNPDPKRYIKPFQWVGSAHKIGYSPEGFIYFPMQFSIEFIFRVQE